jgi:invasion protein IalB
MNRACDLRAITLLAVLAAFDATGAAAQTQTPPQTQTPQRTTATYEDWVVRCEIRGAVKTCEMAQAMQIQGQAQPITQIAIGQQAKGSPMKIVLEVPINVWLPAGAKLIVGDKDTGLLIAYSRCLPAACIADTDVKDEQLKKMRSISENGKLQFKDAGQQDVVIPVSFKGFDQAFQAMQQP